MGLFRPYHSSSRHGGKVFPDRGKKSSWQPGKGGCYRMKRIDGLWETEENGETLKLTDSIKLVTENVSHRNFQAKATIF